MKFYCTNYLAFVISIIRMQDHQYISFPFHSGISKVCCQLDLKTCHYIIKRNISLQIITPQSEHHIQINRLKSIERWVWVSNNITSLHTGGCIWCQCYVKLFYIIGRWHSKWPFGRPGACILTVVPYNNTVLCVSLSNRTHPGVLTLKLFTVRLWVNIGR